jgi:Uma2 family endonuclease
MSTAEQPAVLIKNDYPTSDGRPMAETDRHRDLMFDLIKTAQVHYARDPMVYVSGNLLVFYVPGDKRRHLAPDVFVVKGVSNHERLNYLVWEEGCGPNTVIEITSSSTRSEDTKKKFLLYQNTLRVPEYFLFDPFGDYLRPALQGYRLQRDAYVDIKPIHGRLPSKQLGLHLEQQGPNLRLYDPASGKLLPTPQEAAAEAKWAREKAELALEKLEAKHERAELEILRLRLENEALRRQLSQGS